MVVSSAVGCLVFALHFRKKDSLCRLVRPERREGDPGLLRVWLLWGSRPVWGPLSTSPGSQWGSGIPAIRAVAASCRGVPSEPGRQAPRP